MSKNFELMQEALMQPGTSARESAKVLFLESEGNRKPASEVSDFDAVAQQECFKLVQRIFLDSPISFTLLPSRESTAEMVVAESAWKQPASYPQILPVRSAW